jgi:putative nucleotidyltransferase with HDIG domain
MPRRGGLTLAASRVEDMSLMLSARSRMPLPESPEEMISAAPELAALPVVAQRLLAMARDQRTTMKSMTDLLSTDQALAAAVLRYANCARVMPNRRIGNLGEAITRIGQQRLTDVLIHACAGPLLDRGLPPYALPRRVAWRHAATASFASTGIAKLLHPPRGEGAGVAGLLHDVGKMVLTSVVPEAAAEAVSMARSRHLPVWRAEVLVLGFHHGQVGGALLRSWGLPEAVVDAVTFHHQPQMTANPLATVVFLADAAAHAVGAVGGGGACAHPAWEPDAASALGATSAQVQEFLDNLRLVDEGALEGE